MKKSIKMLALGLAAAAVPMFTSANTAKANTIYLDLNTSASFVNAAGQGVFVYSVDLNDNSAVSTASGSAVELFDVAGFSGAAGSFSYAANTINGVAATFAASAPPTDGSLPSGIGDSALFNVKLVYTGTAPITNPLSATSVLPLGTLTIVSSVTTYSAAKTALNTTSQDVKASDGSTQVTESASFAPAANGTPIGTPIPVSVAGSGVLMGLLGLSRLVKRNKPTVA